MKASYLTKPSTIEIIDQPQPELNAGELLIEIKHVGLCGSDLHYYRHGRLGDNVVTEPLILGHEASGIVAGKAGDVDGFDIGDRVVIEPGLPCFSCSHCRKGSYNLCNDVAFMSVPGYNGALREYVNFSSLGVFKLPDGVSLRDAALIEPLAVGYNAAETAGITAGSSVCIMGAGPIGLTAAEAARIMGAAKIMITDTDDHRLSIASKHGVDTALNILRDDAEKAAGDLTLGRGFDFVIDATGVPSAMEGCISLAAKNSVIVFVGLGEESMRLSGYRMVKKQLTIKGVNRYANHFQPVIELLAAGRYDLNDFISHEYAFEDIVDAFNFATSNSENKMKVMINF